jgi:predicted deacylase
MLTWQNGWQSCEAIPGVTLDVFHWQGSPTGKNALVIAGIHGDEYEGPAAVAEFVGGLDRAGLCGSVTAVPVANPPAFLAGTRTNPDGLNLARCFPGDPNGSPTQRLAAALFSRLASGANYLIDLHSGGVEYVFLPVAGFYGEPSSQNRSFCAARQFGLPALWKLPVTDGVLSWEASKRGTWAIGNEYLGAGQLSADGVAAYRNGIVRCLTDWGFYQAAVSAPPRQQLLVGDWLLASATGLFRSQVSLGQRVATGQYVAVTVSPSGTVLEEFIAASDGIVGGLRSKAFIREGNWAVLVQKESDVE